MESDDRVVDDLAAAILDGTPIDWPSAESSVEIADRSLLDQLKLVAAVASLHRRPFPATGSDDIDPRLREWGHLRLLERIGRGASGEVYRAWDTRLDREVALKLLFRERAGADPRTEAIIEEGRLLARVRHPNVVTIYGAERIDHRVGLWTELIRGRTLEELLGERKSLSAAETVRIGIDLCRAAAAVHAQGLLHRDIKAHNVMLAEDGRLVLMDFGSGWEMEDRPSTLSGTPLYLAPELLNGGRPTVRTDLYSLGILLFHLLTGTYPVRGSGITRLKLAHERRERTDVRTIRPDISRRLARIIGRATDAEPQHRYASVDELAADLSTLTARSKIRRLAVFAMAATLVSVAWIGSEIRRRQVADTATAVAAAERAARVPFDRARVVAINKRAGDKSHPALSPAGDEIAFVSTAGTDIELHVQSVSGGASRRLFVGHAAFPAWAPDGSKVAIVRRFVDELGRNTDEVLTIDVRSGSSHAVLAPLRVFLGNGLDWSPDGAHVVVPARRSINDPWRLMLIPLSAGEPRWVSTPSAGSLGDTFPAYSPDGGSIAFIRDTGSERSLFALNLGRGSESLVSSASSDISRPVWTTDGRNLIYSTYQADSNSANSLWTVPVSGGEPRRIVGTGAGASYPTTARRSERLAFMQTRVDQNLYKVDLSGQSPAIMALAGSSQQDSSPDLSPDGSRVVFASDRSGLTEIWTMSVDGSNASPVTTLGTHTRRPRWSPDGRQIAFDARGSGSVHTDIYVVSSGGGFARRLTTDVSHDTWATWSADGRWIYYLKHVRESSEIWKVPAAGGPSEQVTRDHGLRAQESPDGQFLYYSNAARELWRVPLRGGTATLILKLPSRTEWGGHWTVADAGIYWLNASVSPGSAIDFFNFAVGRSTRVVTLSGMYDLGSNFAVSRDRRLLLVSQRDYAGSDLMMLDAIGEPRAR